jgi:hypothetical protein
LTFDPRFFAELRTRMSPEAQAKTEADAQRLGEEMDLAEVRRALKLSQGEIRQTLELVGAVAKIEKRRKCMSARSAASSRRRPSGTRPELLKEKLLSLPGHRGALAAPSPNVLHSI